MFVVVKPEELVKGKKYKMERFKGYYKERIYWDQLYYVFENVVTSENKPIHAVHCSPIYYTFYEFVSQNPQWKMERRTVNMIVRRLIGDDCFEW